METAYPAIAAFLVAMQAEGWEYEAFPEVTTTAKGVAYPVVAVSLTRTRFGGAPRDDLVHVWVEPAAPRRVPRAVSASGAASATDTKEQSVATWQ